jgi:hypothetical protein
MSEYSAAPSGVCVQNDSYPLSVPRSRQRFSVCRYTFHTGSAFGGILTGVPRSSGSAVFFKNDQLTVGMYFQIEPSCSNT